MENHGTIILRPALLTDRESLFVIRNLPEVRKYIHNPTEISYDQHCAWFDKTLNDPTRIFLVIEKEEKVVGAVRFDKSGDRAIVSVYISPEVWGQGVGAYGLIEGERLVRATWPEVIALDAEVLSDNRGSQKLFQKCGYQENSLAWEKVLCP